MENPLAYMRPASPSSVRSSACEARRVVTNPAVSRAHAYDGMMYWLHRLHRALGGARFAVTGTV
ncbi:MAG: hypothetical protein Tsb0020_16270 [Haliangiales bacterium]